MASSIEVRDLTSEAGEFNFSVSGPFGAKRVRFWGDIPHGPAQSEPALAATLLPAMAVGGRLSIPGPLSPPLQRALPDLQAVLKHVGSECLLAPVDLHTVEVIVGERETEVESSSGGGVGAFFSGGVDSWWTLVSDPEISDLIYVHGFDIPIEDRDASARVELRLREAARGYGKRLHIVRSDLRALLDPLVGWEVSHGAALAAVAHLFKPLCKRISISSTTTHSHPTPRGSNPLHDPLWSVEGCAIEHCGAHKTRTEKIERIVDSSEALEVLRVCWRHVDLYNCGHCEKCLRTMVALEILGALGRCPTFPEALDLDEVSSLRSNDPDLPIWWRENLELARKHEAPSQLVAAIEACIAANPGEAAEAPRNGGSDAEERAEALARELEVIRSSHSWRMTRPLRRIGGVARGLRGRADG